MSTSATLDIGTLRRAFEQRDSAMLTSMYTDDAEMRVIDQNHQPSKPLELHGKQAIGEFLADVCSRDMTHRIMDEVIGRDRISFNQACQYSSGERVLAASVLDLRGGKIARQVTVQAWDE